MGDGTVTEVAALPEQLPVVRGDHDPGVPGHDLEQSGEHSIQVLDRQHLPLTKAGKLSLSEERCRLSVAPLAIALSELAHDAVDARNVRPLSGLFVREGIGVMRLPRIEEVEGRLARV